MSVDIEPIIWLPLEIAGLCLDCNSLFVLTRACPRCASTSVMSLDRFLNREPRYQPRFESDRSAP